MSRPIKTVYRLKATLPYRVEPKDGWMVARCDLIRLSCQGKTETSALRNLKHAIALFVETCLERGTLDNALSECGFSRIKLGNREMWVSGHRASGQEGRLNLRTRMEVREKTPTLSEPSGQQVPTILPWIIEASRGESARAA